MQAQIKGKRGPGAGTLSSPQNQLLEDEWRKWKRADSCHTAGKMSFSQIERHIVRAVARDGEIFVRMITQRMGRSKVPLALELLEADYLDENLNGTAANGNEIRMGIEVNKWHRPVAYHFFQRHPGDYQNVKVAGIEPRIRIPAEEVIHVARFEDERSGVTRAVPWFTSALVRLRHMSGYEEAEVIAARASACQMGFITTPDPDFEPSEGDEVFDDQRVEAFEPGKISTLAPGEQFQAYNPTRPSGLLDPFMRYMLRGVAAGIGASYESLSKDYSQSNYSSSRLALLDDRDTWRELQAWLIDTLHQPLHERFVAMGVLSGALSFSGFETDPEAFTTPRWMPRGWSWIDPAKEIAAYKSAVRGGIMTLSDVVAQNGGDFEELAAARRRELDVCEELDLVFDTDPSLVDGAGAAQSNNPLDPPDPNEAVASGNNPPEETGEGG
jgi:lambda family phage portal protein